MVLSYPLSLALLDHQSRAASPHAPPSHFIPPLLQVGPVNLKFTIPMYSASRIALKYLQILKRSKDYNPLRWVRYVTSSNSYTFRT